MATIWPPKYNEVELPAQNDSVLGFGDKVLSSVPLHQPMESVDPASNLVKILALQEKVAGYHSGS